MYDVHSAGLEETAALDSVRVQERGELVVSHVLPFARQPQPDFEKMQRFISTNLANPAHSHTTSGEF